MSPKSCHGKYVATVLVSLLLALAWVVPVRAQQRNTVNTATAPESAAGGTPPTVEEHVRELESEVQELREQVKEMKAAMAFRGTPSGGVDAEHSTVDVQAPSVVPAADTQGATLLTPEDRSILNYLKGTTINGEVDGYYAYNFNDPVGRVNLLRSYDVLSNAFSLNQADLIIERAPDIADGRRFGARLDLQFGQATATLQGNPVNEPRPDIYRNIFQAYGTYVVPVGSGLTVDFGKWASSLGAEGNYTQYQINYSRSYWFNYLPFYHMGVRANYKVNSWLALNYWIVNGTNQTEPTNGFKDELFGAVITPNKNVTWTIQYYFGQDHPNAVSTSSCGPVPVQPGLCFQQVSPAPNGKTHIFDSYATWQATPKLSFTLEADYVIQRLWVNSAPGESNAPSDVWGGAAYAKYQLTPRTYLAGRTEYLNDHGGLFTGITSYIEALKEVTATYDFQLADGFDMRWEYRRDISNRPIFLSNEQNIYSTHQDTATMGVVWWFGRKQGPW
jgi:Putative beta-barrel porin-2, OmpL-like. bbp2